jgi:hypothetical protein
MKTGVDIMAYYRTLRDYSGSVLDSYAQDLGTFFSSCILNNELEAFYQQHFKVQKTNIVVTKSQQYIL